MKGKSVDTLLAEESVIRQKVLEEHERCTGLLQKRQPEGVDFLTKIPLQMFIADNEGKDTCLVFFIGSDNLHTEKKIKGFYTEFPDVVKLFKGIFEGILRDHRSSLPGGAAGGLAEEEVIHAGIPGSH